MVTKRLMAEKQIDGAADFGLVGVDPHHVIEADVELIRPIEDVRRLAGPSKGASMTTIRTRINTPAGTIGTIEAGM